MSTTNNYLTRLCLYPSLLSQGIMRRLPEGFDGNKCQECFTWSTERPNKTWAMGSGCSPYYNTHSTKNANTRMVRYFEEDRFEIFAKGDVKAGEVRETVERGASSSMKPSEERSDKVVSISSLALRTFYTSEERSNEITSVVDCRSKQNSSHVVSRLQRHYTTRRYAPRN